MESGHTFLRFFLEPFPQSLLINLASFCSVWPLPSWAWLPTVPHCEDEGKQESVHVTKGGGFLQINYKGYSIYALSWINVSMLSGFGAQFSENFLTRLGTPIGSVALELSQQFSVVYSY